MLQRHDYKPLVAVCEECHKLGARQVVHNGPPTGRGDDPAQPRSARKLCHGCAESSKDSHPYALRQPLPYRPLKLGDWHAAVEAEQEARRREESFAQHKRAALDKLEGGAATRIQRVWRGCWSRRAHAGLVAARKAWLRQRRVDDEVRAQVGYRVAKVFGVAKELVSDTTVEKVLKRYPAWRADFITDVVHGDWAECLEMAQEQDAHVALQRHGGRAFLSPFSGASEAWQLAAATAQLGVAARAQAAKRREADAATAAYRYARSAPAVTESERASLQQEMRGAKAEQESATARVARAQAKVDGARQLAVARRGPRRLAARAALVQRQGWATDQPVAAAHSSVFLAPIEAPRAPGQSRPQKSPSLQPGQYVKLAGSAAVFRVVANYGNPSSRQAVYQKCVAAWVRFAGKLEGLDADAIAARTPSRRFPDAMAACIKVDRCWTHPDAQPVAVYVLPRLPPPARLAYAAVRTAKASPPAQAAVAAWETCLAAVARQLAASAHLFDEEAAMHGRLQRYAASTWRRKESVRHLRSRLGPPANYVSTYSEVSSLGATLKRIARKGQARAAQERKEKAERKRQATDPLQKFIDSPYQLEVVVAWQDSGKESETPEPVVLGFFMVDMEIPLGLARTLLGRYLWPELNSKGGRNFLFQLSAKDQDSVEIGKEATTKVGAVALQKLNPLTKRVEYTLVLRPDPEVKGVATIEPWNWDDRVANLTTRKSQPPDDGDEPENVRFQRVRAQTARHMGEVRKLLGLQEPAESAEPEEKPARDEPPAALSGGAAADEGQWQSATDDEGGTYWYNDVETTYADPNKRDVGAEPLWVESRDDNGDMCFYNTKTGQTTYEEPY
jgi:hypothetical protein